MQAPLTDLASYFVVVVFALLAVYVRAIDRRGFLASVAVGFAIIFGGGVLWFIMVAVFFGLGVGFTWYKYSYKKRLGGAQEKGGARGWPNILANGGLASCFAVGNLVLPSNAFAALFLGSVSAAAADTVATELGLLNKSPPRLLTHPGQVVAPGTSGGVSVLGYAGASLASAVMGAMALLLGVLGPSLGVVAICIVGGVVGATFDSLLGATLQRRGFCRVCLKQTESVRHCGETTRRTGGFAYLENNLVNLLATAGGAFAALAVAVVLGL